MKKIFFIFFFVFFSNITFAKNIVYLDVQFLIDNSNLGIKYKDEILAIQTKINSDLKNKQNSIKEKELELNNQKNVLKKEEFNKKLKNLDKMIIEYRKFNKVQNKIIQNKKKFYSDEILKIINPILTEYVEKNNIDIVIEKKNVLVGIKTLDITKDILKTLNEKTTKNN